MSRMLGGGWCKNGFKIKENKLKVVYRLVEVESFDGAADGLHPLIAFELGGPEQCVGLAHLLPRRHKC